MRTLLLKPDKKELDNLNNFILSLIVTDNTFPIEIILEEVFVNIVNYSNATFIQVNFLDVCGDLIKIQFIDDGIPFNPKSVKDQDVDSSLDQRKIGGLGIYLVKKYAYEISYEYVDNLNKLTILIGI
ncbi:MAG: ATP-binding protein [Methanobacteriaceae archaeon]|nr:ATP-binding protein [Methanobacteriaceae archaeon]